MAWTLVDKTQHRLPQHLRIQLKAIAEITGSGYHGVLRRAIESYLAGEGRDVISYFQRRQVTEAGVDDSALNAIKLTPHLPSRPTSSVHPIRQVTSWLRKSINSV